MFPLTQFILEIYVRKETYILQDSIFCYKGNHLSLCGFDIKQLHVS